MPCQVLFYKRRNYVEFEKTFAPTGLLHEAPCDRTGHGDALEQGTKDVAAALREEKLVVAHFVPVLGPKDAAHAESDDVTDDRGWD